MDCLICPECGAPVLLVTRKILPTDIVRSKDFLHLDLSPVDPAGRIPRCPKCGVAPEFNTQHIRGYTMDYSIEIQAMKATGPDDYVPADGDNDATEFGVYVRRTGPYTASHVLSFPTRSQAEAFALGLGADVYHVMEGNRDHLPEDDPTTTDLTAYQSNEVAEQAALFMHVVDHDRWNGDKTNGGAGLYTIIADHALTFCRYHWEESIGIEDYWDAKDWYITSDDYFIAPEIYHQ